MKRGYIAVVAEASHWAPGRAVTADPAVLAARTIPGVDIGAARRAAADFLSALGIANLVAFLVSEDGRWVNGQMIRANGVIGSQTQGYGPGISRIRGTARSAAPFRSTSTPGGHHEHH